jgi:hypothetical protein
VLFNRRRKLLSVICNFGNVHDSVRLVCDNNEVAQKSGPCFGWTMNLKVNNVVSGSIGDTRL